MPIRYMKHETLNGLEYKEIKKGSDGRLLKAVKEKDQLTYKDRSIRITGDFSMETQKPEEPQQMFYKLKDHRCQTKIL